MIQVNTARDLNARHLVWPWAYAVSGELNDPGTLPIRRAYGVRTEMGQPQSVFGQHPQLDAERGETR
jgi:hypothetical protein